MSASFVVVLPAIAQDLAVRCVDSMCARLRDETLLVDNTQTGEIAASFAGRVGFTSRSGRNLGVPRSWNAGVHYMRANSADYLVIVSQSITFGTSGGADFLDELNTRAPLLMCAQYGWKLIAVRADVFDRVGMFDEVFTPAYWEESDLLYRMHLAGLPSALYNEGRHDQVTVDAASEGDGVTLLRALVLMDYRAQAKKYSDKWGGAPCEERWTHPYGDTSLDWTYTGKPLRTVNL